MSARAIRPAWSAAAVVLVVVGVTGAWVSAGPGRLGAGLSDAVPGWVLGGSGLAAWRVAPVSRVGPLLVAAGMAIFVGEFAACLDVRPLARACLRPPLLPGLAGALAWLWTGFLVHAITSFPTGRIHRRPDGALVVGGYAAAMAATAWWSDMGPLLFTTAFAGMLSLRWAGSMFGERRTRRPAILGSSLIAVAMAFATLVGPLRTAMGGADPFLASLALGLRPVTPQTTLPVACALLGVWLASAVAGRQRQRRRAADRVVELGAVGGSLEDARSTLEAGSAELDDVRLAAAIARADELLSANAALQAEVDAMLSAVLASRERLLDAALTERQDLEGRLHDGAERQLDMLAAELDAAAIEAADGAPASRERVDRARQQLAEARKEVAELARGLHPRALDVLGLAGALTELCARSPVPASLTLVGEPAAGRAAAATLWFVASEALANAAKHADASAVRVELRAMAAGGLRLVVQDDGRGGASVVPGGGLDGLRARLEALGGDLRLEAARGVRLVATLPGDEAHAGSEPPDSYSIRFQKRSYQGDSIG